MVTPFLNPLNEQGGTLYVFPSVSKDLTRTFVSNDYEFKFSHFACLNIPNILIIDGSDSDEMPKGLYLESLYKDNNIPNEMGKSLAENLQNYVFNFETAILNGDYDSDILTTVSEKIFWNWMQKVGAIEFNGDKEKYTKLEDRTVQYIGNIDVMNTVENDGDSYEELYIHIPSSVGASTDVLFRDGYLTDNKNYKDCKLNDENIIGRSGVVHPYNLSINALYDEDKGENIYRADVGHTIDFRDSSYAGGDGIYAMNENSTSDFQFNAVLIYYDFYKKLPNNTKQVSTNLYGILFIDNIKKYESETYIERYPKYKDRNSFALKIDLKIDTLPDINGTPDYKIYNYESIFKKVTKLTEADENFNQLSNFLRQNSNVVAMSLYEKSLTQLQKCIDIFYKQEDEIRKLSERIETLETMIMGIDTVETLRGQIDRLFNLYDSSGNNTYELQNLIELNSKKIDAIIKGGKDINLQYDTDVIQQGYGIKLDKSPNKIVINSNNNYSIGTFYSDDDYSYEISKENRIDISSKNECYIKLKNGENFAILYTISDDEIYNKDIFIYIDDSEYDWTVGQSFKIFINPDKDFSFSKDRGFVIKTGYYKEDDDLEYMQEINIDDNFEGKNIIELICVGDEVKTKENQFIYLTK